MNINCQHHSAVLQFHNLPVNVTAREIADWFWSVCGLALQTDSIEIRKLESGLFAQAIVMVGRRELADYFDRLLAEQLFHGKQIVVRPKH